ncbi:hypothetical protein BH10PSE2_BH10PSE2_04760 [soil metagenome]
MSLSPVLSSPRAAQTPSALAGGDRAVGGSARKAADGSPSVFSQPLVPMLTAAAVALLIVVAVRLGMSPAGIVVLWGANAVAVAMWLRSGRGRAYDISYFALISVSVFAGEMLSGYGPRTSLLLTGANLVEIIAAVVMTRRFAPGHRLNGVKPMVRLALTTAVAAPMLGALAGATCLFLIKGTPVRLGFETWWLSHALGMVLIVPLLLSFKRAGLVVVRPSALFLEWAVAIAAATALSYFVYVARLQALTYFMTPLITIIALRLRVPGVALAMLIMAVAVMTGLLHHLGARDLLSMPLSGRILNGQLMVIFATMTFLLVATLLNERDALSIRAAEGQKRAELASVAKSRLLANVAHEIKSPVGGVIGIGELWSSGQLGPITPTQREMADMLVKTARQVEALAHDLLDVARAESGAVKVDLRPTDVPGVVEDVRRATLLRPEAKGLKIDVIADGDGLIALADSQRLTQVVDNLATNAVKYGGSGGVILFRIARTDAGIRLEVTDKGPGLTPAKQAQLFEPFNRLGLERSTVEGHGIGLALSRSLVELQGGTIGVVSSPGEGSTFWVELPAA